MVSKSVHYALSVLSPIRHGRVDGGDASHERALREYLAKMEAGGDSPFADLPMLHLSRFMIIDRLPDLHGAAGEVLKHHYLLFLADIDGERDDFLDAMADVMPDEIAAIWDHCAGFPMDRTKAGSIAPFDFRHYVRKHEIENLFLFEGVECKDKSVQDILRAVQEQRLLADFIAKYQDATSAVRQNQFKLFLKTISAAPLPRHGTG